MLRLRQTVIKTAPEMILILIPLPINSLILLALEGWLINCVLVVNWD